MDGELTKELRRCVGKRRVDEKWDPEFDPGVDEELWKKCSYELYEILCGITRGEAKSILKGLVHSGGKMASGD